MTTYSKFSFFIVIPVLLLALFVGANTSEASSLLGEGRYFVSTESSIVKKLFGARHNFEGAFTADLTRGEIWTLEKIFRISVDKVPIYNLSQEEEGIETEDNGEGDGFSAGLESLFDRFTKDKEETIETLDPQERSIYPEEQISWGLKLLYGDYDIASTEGGGDIRLAILDTGINKSHPDLVGRIGGCVDFTRSSIVEDLCEDKNGHGTHSAGVIAADGSQDGLGAWGVSPGASIFSYKVCNADGICWADDVARAIDYAIEKDINIINLSFGGGQENSFVYEAISRAYQNNILILAPAGNNGPDNEAIDFPASHENVIAVGMVDPAGEIPDWSSRGANNGDFIIGSGDLELVAPGIDIESTWIDNQYKRASGSSVAASFVSGLAARLWDGSATSTRATLAQLAVDVAEEGDDALSGLGLPVLRGEQEEYILLYPDQQPLL